MATPTISSVEPSTVWSGGQLVVVRGTGFRLPSTPPLSNRPLPDPIPTVSATVDGLACVVEVLSSTVLSCRITAHAPGASRLDLVVRNLDDEGAPISGESAALSRAVLFARPDLAAETDAGRVERALIQILKAQIIDNVVKLAVSPDYVVGDVDEVYLPELADPPGLVLAGPRVREERPEYRTESGPTMPSVLGGDRVDLRKRPTTVSLEYSVSGYTNSGRQSTELALLTRRVLELNPWLVIQRDPADASKGVVKYPLTVPLEAESRDTSVPNKDGNHAFDGLSVVIHGVALDEVGSFAGSSLERVGVAEQTEFVLEMTGKA